LLSNRHTQIKNYSPQILALIFLGYAPLLGESFRFYVLPFSGFIVIAAIFTLWHWREFTELILKKDAIIYGWMLIIGYCIINTFLITEKNPTYFTYLDLGAFFVALFGMFFGRVLSNRISIHQLVIVLLIILVLLFTKMTYALLGEVELIPGGGTIFSGSASYGDFPRIVFTGSNPFLVTAVILLIGIIGFKNISTMPLWIKIISFLLLINLIAIAGVRSIYFAVLPCIIILLVVNFCKNKSKQKIYLFALIILLYSSYAFIGSRGQSSISQFEPSIEKYSIGNAKIVDENSLKKIIDIANEVKIRSIILKIIEYSDVVNSVSDHKWTGLGMGSTYANIALENMSHYVHSQPFWLYLKGGFLLVSLFYIFVIFVLLQKYQVWIENSKNIQNLFIVMVLIGLCNIDILTNQFPTIAGAFYFGFFVVFKTK